MKTLNLVYEDKSDIKYKKIQFPDGQQNLIIKNKLNDLLIVESHSGTPVYRYYPVQIKSRLNNFLDLELIICAVASLRELGVEEIHLYVPYIMGARSDKKFEEGGNNYLKDVICPVINSLNFKTVTCIDSHSDVLEACIKGFRKESNKNLVEWALDSKFSYYASPNEVNDSNFILISPDSGASKKIYKLSEQIGYKGKIYTATKDRDRDGNLSKQSIPDYTNDRFEHMNKDVIIIDDIGDGCSTFINLAELIKYGRHQKCTGKTYLIITHGIFSNGFKELSKYFDEIYCTNSYSDLKFHPSVNDIIGPSEKFVKQLNVF